MTLGLVWAQANGGVIGADGMLPWHLPEDLKAFKELTTGTTVVMGRRTWASLPDRFRPLPDRRNVVISRQPGFTADGAEVVTSPDDAIAKTGPVWVIGGAQIYAALEPHAALAVRTDIDLDVEGDAFAPTLDGSWRLEDRRPATGWLTSTTGLRYAISTYRRDTFEG